MGKKLTDSQIQHYRDHGFVCPVDALPGQQAAACLRELETFEAGSNQQIGKGFNFKPHLLFPWVDEIGRHPAVLDAVEDLIGPNILLFNLAVWPKNAHDPAYVTWHQDSTYFGLDPSTQVTIWVALSDASVEAGCMEVIPGSHKLGQLHHGEVPSKDILLSKGQTIDVPFDRSRTAFMPLEAGQFSIHDTYLIHASGANQADHRRVGLGFSYIPTHARHIGSTRLTAMLVRGVDEYGYYDAEPRPVTSYGDAERAFHGDAVARFKRGMDEQAAKY
jgi:hypothetical protein